MDKPWIVVLRGVLRDEQGRYLLLQRSLKSKNWAGRWEFPGGKVDAGEDLKSALEREFLEETGLSIIPKKILTGYDHERECDRLVYLVSEVHFAGDNRTVRVSNEHEAYGWFTLNEVQALEQSPPMLKTMESLA